MLIAARNAMLAGGGGASTPDVQSYAGFSDAWSFWDGIRNVGASAPHDDSATTWCDLARNSNTLAISSQMYFGSKGLHTVYNDGVKFGGTNASNYFYVTSAIQELTCEVVVDLEELAPSPGAAGGVLGIEMGLDRTITYGTPYSVKYYVWGIRQPNYAYNASSLVKAGMMSFVAVYSVSQSLRKLYINGVSRYSSTGDLGGFTPDARYQSEFNREFSYLCGLTGTYHRVSIVNRALTDSEVADNWAIDQVRFGTSA